MKTIAYLTALFFLTISINVKAQVSQSEKKEYKPIEFTQTWDEFKNSEKKDSKKNLNIDTIIIVKFKGDPLCLMKDNDFLKSGKTTNIEKTFERFQSDLNNFSISAGLKSATKSSLRSKYKNAYLGASVKIPANLIQEIKKLDYIENVYPNSVAHAPIDTSAVNVMKGYANKTEYAYTGKGVKIGILDSGIDYTHPALGNGYGISQKVVGGYDFVNDDNDPMDDNGHGTQVAGIIAAECEEMKGIAPDAELFAIKVLDNNSIGTLETFLEGIEWAIDPNGDGNFSDNMDILNISLGFDFGSPDDPASLAVDNAVEIGIVCCVAAGNSGSMEDRDYFSISSPGASEKAITVGAVDQEKVLLQNSSKGPNRKTFSIKPDICGLGENIFSTDFNGGSATHYGTSYSTPQITAASALLLEKNNTHTPQEIKSILCSSADNTIGVLDQRFNEGYLSNCMETGAGYLNIEKALNAKTLLSASKWEIFINDFNQNISESEKTFSITNKSSQEQTYYFENYSSNGLALSSAKTSLTIPAGVTDSITINSRVLTDALPQPQLNSENISGKYNIYCSTDTLAITWSLMCGPIVNFKFSEALLSHRLVFNSGLPRVWDNFILTNNENYYNFNSLFFVDSLNAVANILPGEYTLIALGGNSDEIKYFIKENISIDKNEEVYIDFTQSVNEIEFKGLKPDGKEFERVILNSLWLALPNKNQLSIFMTQFVDSKLLFNNFDNIDVYCGCSAMDSDNDTSIYLINFDSFNSLSQDTILSNNISDYETLIWDLKNPNAESLNLVYDFYTLSDLNYDESWVNTSRSFDYLYHKSDITFPTNSK